MSLQDNRLSARFDGELPADLIPHCAEHIREAGFPVTAEGSRLSVDMPQAQLGLTRDATGFSLALAAVDTAILHQTKEYIAYLLDHIRPGAAEAMQWQGAMLRNTTPPNFHLAHVQRVERVAPNFLRVTLGCAGVAALKAGKGMHFGLLLPPKGRTPVWPRIDGRGKTVLPEGADALHRAVYTFVTLDPENGSFSFDVFEHEGGRTTAWAQAAQAGEIVGLTGPGSGGFPPGDAVLMAGDETALPAIRRILAHSPEGRRGKVFLEVGSAEDICEIAHPEGINLTWVLRDQGACLWDHLQSEPLPEGSSRFVWVAAEQALIRKAKARFRTTLGLRTEEGYFAYYWVA